MKIVIIEALDTFRLTLYTGRNHLLKVKEYSTWAAAQGQLTKGIRYAGCTSGMVERLPR